MLILHASGFLVERGERKLEEARGSKRREEARGSKRREEARGSKRKQEERGSKRKQEEARGSKRKQEEARGNLSSASSQKSSCFLLLSFFPFVSFFRKLIFENSYSNFPNFYYSK